MVVALAKHPVVDNYDLSALRWILSGVAPLSADLAIDAASGSDARWYRAMA